MRERFVCAACIPVLLEIKASQCARQWASQMLLLLLKVVKPIHGLADPYGQVRFQSISQKQVC